MPSPSYSSASGSVSAFGAYILLFVKIILANKAFSR